MSLLKVFVASTCYDLDIVRSQLRSFILEMGHEPVMSEYCDILFDPRLHTHESCVKEVQNCDLIILIIGSRFGGEAIPKVLDSIDIENIRNTSKARRIFDGLTNLSITQLEMMKAIEVGIPTFTFIDTRVLRDHLVYEKNKDREELINWLHLD